MIAYIGIIIIGEINWKEEHVLGGLIEGRWRKVVWEYVTEYGDGSHYGTMD